MQSLRRTAVTAARKGKPTLPRQPRRFAHDEAHGHSHAGVDEPMGTGFYATIAVIPAGLALYYISKSDSENSRPFFTRLIDGYTAKSEEWAKNNDLHVRMIEQAGEDRVLFANTRPQEYIDMRFPELMNNGSPFNVRAGSQVPLDQVIEKYQKLAYEDNERKHEALKNNEIKSEQPLKPRLRKGPVDPL